jgi:hypothetical protein
MAANRGVRQHGNVAKHPRDPNQLAKLIVDIATGEAKDDLSTKYKRKQRSRVKKARSRRRSRSEASPSDRAKS